MQIDDGPPDPGATATSFVRENWTYLGAASDTFTGGATVLPTDGPSETTAPLWRTTRRVNTEAQMRQRLSEEFDNFFVQNFLFIALLLLVLAVVLITALVLVVWALAAVILYSDLPCDQPLSYYIFPVLIWSQFPRCLFNYLRPVWGGRLHLMIVCRLLLCVPGCCIIGWGLYMIHASKTCAKTNPGLYWPICRFIYGQIAITFVFLVITAIAVLFFRRVMLLVALISPRQGCEKAVRALPKVPNDSNELIDAEDNKVMDCPICMESYMADMRAVVRAPCGHYYHEDCLATWCKTHLDCPLCRNPVGDADGDPEAASNV